jgi:hypothetical protein
MAPTPPIELFIELKPRKTISLVKWSHTKRGLNKSIRDLNQFIVFYTKSIL